MSVFFEKLRVLWDDSGQNGRFSVLFGVNMPPYAINRKKITLTDRENGHGENTDGHGRRGRTRSTPLLYGKLYLPLLPFSPPSVLCPLSFSLCPLSFSVQNATNFSSVFVQIADFTIFS